MTHEEEQVAWTEVRNLIKNILGFHDLAELDDVRVTAARRLQYDAYVYASGVTLARKLHALIG